MDIFSKRTHTLVQRGLLEASKESQYVTTTENTKNNEIKNAIQCTVSFDSALNTNEEANNGFEKYLKKPENLNFSNNDVSILEMNKELHTLEYSDIFDPALREELNIFDKNFLAVTATSSAEEDLGSTSNWDNSIGLTREPINNQYNLMNDNNEVLESNYTDDTDLSYTTSAIVQDTPEVTNTSLPIKRFEPILEDYMDDPERDPSYQNEGSNTSSSDDSEAEVIPVKRRCPNKQVIQERGMDIEETGSCDAETVAKDVIEDIMQNVFIHVFKKSSTVRLRRESKQKKDRGEEYVDRKGNVRAARKMGHKCNGCRFDCKIIDESDREEIFREYWKIADRNVQVQYITSLITEKTVEVNHKCYRVCKNTFLSTFGIGKRFIDVITKNKTQSGTSCSDRRGKKEPSNKSKPADIKMIHDHISKFPCYESHYSRRDSKKNYLHPDLNIHKMYKLYVDECKSANKKPLCYTIYYNIFKTANLSFKKPYNDTCRTCDELKIKLKDKNLDEEDRKKLELEKQNHLAKVDKAYTTKANDKMLAKASGGKIVVKAFDMQKVLETPSLTTGTSFYKRQLSTYNLTTHDLATNQASSYLWYESIGGRGSDEVASILYKDIKNLNDEVEQLIYYSDNCTGQNHNFTLPLMYEIAIKLKPNLKSIEHKFLVVGHTHMECDSDHARIERAKPKDMEIFIPRDWYTMIRMLKNKRGEPFFNVFEMKLTDFYDFKSLYIIKSSPYIKRQKL